MKKIDLHTHTTASDGIYPPRALIDLARSNGLVAMAITDHDTVDGLGEALEYAASVGFRLFPGIEFSIDYDEGSFHLIGLNLDHGDASLINKIGFLTEEREKRAYRIIEDLHRHGIDIPIEEVLAESGGGSIGRPHVARVMVDRGYAASIKELFRSYLVKGKPGYVKKTRIAFREAVDLIHACGGIPVVAHPVSLECRDMDHFETLLRGFVDAGVEGIEAYAAMHTPEMAEAYRALGERYGLLITGGSDFHGDKDEVIGYFRKGELIPPGILERLEERISAGPGHRRRD